MNNNPIENVLTAETFASVSTSGWDVVSVTDLDVMNKVINETPLYKPDNKPSNKKKQTEASKCQSPFETTIETMSGDMKLSGCWDKWKISKESSGKNVRMSCTVLDGSVEAFSLNTRYELNSPQKLSSLEIQVSLEGIADDPKKWLKNNTTSSITSNTQCFKLMMGSRQKIIITSSNFTNENLPKPWISSVESAFTVWFQENKNSFQQIFSVILIGLKAKKSDFEWLQPSAYSYAVSSAIDKKTAGFGALTLVDGKKEIGHLDQSLSVAALQWVKPLGGNTALIISKEMFVKHILLKAAVGLIKDSSEADFEISETGLSLTNKKDMVWQDFVGPENKTWSPTIPKGSFILTLQSDFIHINILNAHYRPQFGVTVTMSLIQNFRYKVEKNKNGEPIFVPDEKGMGDAEIHSFVKLDDWLNWLELVTGIISSIAAVFAASTALAGAISKGALSTLVGNAATRTASFSFKLFNYPIRLSTLTPIAVAIQRGVISNPTIFNVLKIGSLVTVATTGITAGAIAIADAIYKHTYTDFPSFKFFADNLTGAIQWPNIKNIELKSATLADSFVIGLRLGK